MPQLQLQLDGLRPMPTPLSPMPIIYSRMIRAALRSVHFRMYQPSLIYFTEIQIWTARSVMETAKLLHTALIQKIQLHG